MGETISYCGIELCTHFNVKLKTKLGPMYLWVIFLTYVLIVTPHEVVARSLSRSSPSNLQPFRLRWSASLDLVSISEKTSDNEYVTRMKCWYLSSKQPRLSMSTEASKQTNIQNLEKSRTDHQIACRCENSFEHQRKTFELVNHFGFETMVTIAEECNFSLHPTFDDRLAGLHQLISHATDRPIRVDQS